MLIMLKSIERNNSLEYPIDEWQTMGISDYISVPEHRRLDFHNVLEPFYGTAGAQMQHRTLRAADYCQCAGGHRIAEVRVRVDLRRVHTRKQQRPPEEQRPST